jgi:hypothetical protein
MVPVRGGNLLRTLVDGAGVLSPGARVQRSVSIKSGRERWICKISERICVKGCGAATV